MQNAKLTKVGEDIHGGAVISCAAMPRLHTPLRGDYIPPAAEDIHGFAVIWNG